MGILIPKLQYFDSWTLSVSLRGKKWPNKGIDLDGKHSDVIYDLDRKRECVCMSCQAMFVKLGTARTPLPPTMSLPYFIVH